ncbi:hypothetical protein BCR43DRAFT_293349 [Syncephalastrum racemosum]|uniref:Uncharacterized protein n=1 Tax=Syncephalastrum racemosum TaxID=13706 RepID=A0A1X2HDU1_SYNRA|nr:hypothetical protein BCR43DRAFT_293349 [Syncephalastrum racemosum]
MFRCVAARIPVRRCHSPNSIAVLLNRTPSRVFGSALNVPVKPWPRTSCLRTLSRTYTSNAKPPAKDKKPNDWSDIRRLFALAKDEKKSISIAVGLLLISSSVTMVCPSYFACCQYIHSPNWTPVLNLIHPKSLAVRAVFDGQNNRYCDTSRNGYVSRPHHAAVRWWSRRHLHDWCWRQ